MRQRRWLIAAAVVAAGALAAAATYDPGTGTLSLSAGDQVQVTCPNALTRTARAADSIGLACAPDTTTTTAASTTTTVPATTTTTTSPPPPPPSGCGLSAPAFCETFDQPAVNPPSNQRAGQLDGVLWGTSMETGNQPGNQMTPTALACGGSGVYPANVQVCGGQMVTTVDDGGTVTSLAAYPRQPFDFAGRTGTITFDVSNDSAGNHAAWPELWVTDQPLPDPFTHEGSWQSLPRNGFGIRFAGCPSNCSGPGQVGVDSAIVVTGYRPDDSFNGGAISVSDLGDVAKSGPGQTNHYQVQVSAAQIDVYGTDPFTPGSPIPPLKHLSTISGFGTLGFTRGLVWLEDAHYNGNKFATQGTHTFRWDNLGFDGPALPRDLGFDVPNPAGTAEAYQAPATVTIPDVSGQDRASGALVEFNFYSYTVQGFDLTLNGNPIHADWPFPDQLTYSPRTIAIPVPLADVQAGDNTLTLSAGGAFEQFSNVNLILQGAGADG